jgi:hypothetical protein
VIHVIDFGLVSGQGFDAGGKPPFKLVVVIGIEKVMFPIVLVMDDKFYRGKARGKGGRVVMSVVCVVVPQRRRHTSGRRIDIAAPRKEGLGEVVYGIPSIGVDEGLEASPVSPGTGSEDTR